MAEPASVGTRQRLLSAALSCFERAGLRGTSLDEVARTAGMSRATVYRYFPAGREQLVADTISWEVGRFLRRLGAAVAAAPDLAGQLRAGLVWGHRAIEEHRLLQQILATEPEELLADLAEVAPRLEEAVRVHLRQLLDDEDLCAGVDPDRAADHLTRLFISFLGSPGRWDLSDDASVERLVRTQLLAGIVEV